MQEGDNQDVIGEPQATDDHEPHPLDLLSVSLVLFAVFVADCIYQNRPPAAYGLALVSVAAVVATPSLVFNSVTRHVVRSELRAKLAASVRRISLSLCLIGAVVIGVFLGTNRHHYVIYTPVSIAAILVVTGALMFMCGTYGLALYLLIGLGTVPVSLDNPSGRVALWVTWQGIDNVSRRWFVAGMLFFGGTLIQFFNL